MARGWETGMVLRMSDGKKQVMVLGGGFAGLYTAMHLEKEAGADVEIVLMSRENYFLVTPLLFEAGSGMLDPRHVVSPIRKLIKRARFVEAEVESVDVEKRVVQATQGKRQLNMSYDQLVVALGGVTNVGIIPGAEKAMTFKTLSDAIALRNHVIDLFERADVELDEKTQREMMTFVIVGAGLVGVELMGELEPFVRTVKQAYPRVKAEWLRFVLIEGGPKILPELEVELGAYAAKVLEKRGVEVKVGMRVEKMEEETVYLPTGEVLKSQTIIVATGVVPNPLVAGMNVLKDKRGRMEVEGTMRSKSHQEIWSIGDCANIPGPDGKPYPALAQHALREAKVLAKNVAGAMRGEEPRAFVYRTLGTLAALGHYNGVGRVWKFRVKGIVAWWVWRTYYLMQMPRWERRVRLVMDWTIALFFRYDVVKLDLGEVESRL